MSDIKTIRSFFNGRAALVQLSSHADHRGQLIPCELTPLFVPLRTFLVNGVPDGTVRGGHAHRSARQLMICLVGCVIVELRSEGEAALVRLDHPTEALLVEPGVWASETYHSAAQLLVFASEPYDANGYVEEDAPGRNQT